MADYTPGLDDPDYAAFAWARFRKVMTWMTLVAMFCIGAALAGLNHFYGPLSIMAVLATILGVGMSVMLAAVLMGLIFLSSGTGHDQVVGDYRVDDDQPGN